MLWSMVSITAVLLKYTLLLLIAGYCWFRWSHRELLRASAKLPYFYPAFPIIGHAYFCLLGREEMTRRFLNSAKLAAAKGIKATAVWCGPFPIIAVHDIDDIKMVLYSSNTIDKGSEYDFFKDGINCGLGEFKYSLLTAPGGTWKVLRRHMNPLFHPRNLQLMVPVFNRNSREFLSCLAAHVGQGPVNIMPHTMTTSLKTVCNLLFGTQVKIDINSEEFQGLKHCVEMIPELFIIRIERPWLWIKHLYCFIYKKQLDYINRTWKLFTETPLQITKAVSDEKQEHLNTSDSRPTGKGLPDLKDNLDDGLFNIVDAYRVLQENHPEYTEADMVFETLSFYATGTDTLGSAVSSCLLALAQYQDIQERLYNEVTSVVGSSDDVTLQDLHKMPYLDQVVKESLRWFVVVPYIMRRAEKDITLSSCTVPAGNTILLAMAGLYQDPRHYKDPYKFDPERFSPDRVGDIERFSFIPFSSGPRNCIAKTYAMQLMKIMVVHVLRRYKVSTDMDINNLRRKLTITLVNADGYNISFQDRK